jgi:hypothetical protein
MIVKLIDVVTTITRPNNDNNSDDNENNNNSNNDNNILYGYVTTEVIFWGEVYFKTLSVGTAYSVM